MSPKFLAGVKYWWGIAVGGIGGALTSYCQQVGLNIDFNQLDWHKIGQVAAMGAVTALAFHLTPSPTQKPVSPTPTSIQPEQPPSSLGKGQTSGT